jgi:FkbM family methyltransferase
MRHSLFDVARQARYKQGDGHTRENTMLDKLRWYLAKKRRRHHLPKGVYSQFGQDAFIAEHFKQKRGGVFLDIGANDGVTFSNTLHLEQALGWSGIAVEPHPEVFEKLKKARTCHLFNGCVSDRDGSLRFLAVSGGASELSTLSVVEDAGDEHHQALLDRMLAQYGGEKRVVEVPCLTPASLLRRFGVDRIDYLSLDTEGCEMQILRSFDFAACRVEVVDVENREGAGLFDWMTANGYRLLRCLGCDEIYIRSKP